MADEQRPSTPVKRDNMTRDERIQAQVYRGLGWTYQQIADHMQKTPARYRPRVLAQQHRKKILAAALK